MIELVLPGKPIPKKRPRFSAMGKFVQVYNPSKKEQEAAEIVLRSLWTLSPIEGPVELNVAFYMPIPSSWSKSKQERFNGAPHICTPDVDNTLKQYLDVMNGIVYVDDRQIHKITAVKKYDKYPRTVIKVIWLEENLDSTIDKEICW